MLVLPLSRGELGSLAPPKTHTLRGHLFGHPGLVAFAAEVRSPLAMDPDGATECVVEKLKKKTNTMKVNLSILLPVCRPLVHLRRPTWGESTNASPHQLSFLERLHQHL